MQLTVTSVTPSEKGRATVCFEDGSEITLYKGEIRKLGLTEGAVISEEVYDTILKGVLGTRATKRAMHLLERQDRTERQLYEKLKQNGYPEVCILQAIEYVKSYHYIDDHRYAANYIRCHQEKKSRQRLKIDLQGKGIAKEIIEDALEEEYCTDECRKIQELLQKRHYSYENTDRNEQRKHYQFLLRRGFCSHDILKVMKSEEIL